VCWTTLRVDEAGVVLFDLHRARLARAGAEALRAFDRFAREADAGVWGIAAGAEGIRPQRRSASLLHDGMPVRWAPSPVAAAAGPMPKPSPPGPYAGVRAPGVATLLTDAGGTEILESCSAAVVGWDGTRFVCVPYDRPRVDSVAERALRAHLPFREAPLPVRDSTPLLLLNAVKGPCRIAAEGREPFPAEPYDAILNVFGALTRRP